MSLLVLHQLRMYCTRTKLQIVSSPMLLRTGWLAYVCMSALLVLRCNVWLCQAFSWRFSQISSLSRMSINLFIIMPYFLTLIACRGSETLKLSASLISFTNEKRKSSSIRYWRVVFKYQSCHLDSGSLHYVNALTQNENIKHLQTW